ncbi:MAG: mandelate racemase/muconate lactonizing enzyme family protein [Bacillota bacterium]
MKISLVETFPLYYPLKQPYGDANGYKQYRSCFLIRITTQSGLSGWGECTDWLPALMVGFEKQIIPFLLGKKALDQAQLVQYIKKWHLRSASAVSMALTEIAANFSGLSICDLWGGKFRSEIPVYASFQSYTEQADWVGQSLALVQNALAEGFNHVKLKVGGKTFPQDYNHIKKIYTLLSENQQLILDANQSYDVATALKWNQLFADWDKVLWFEEPLPLNQVENYRLLRSKLSTPVAGGENLKSSIDFLPMLQGNALDIIQPDPAHQGGIEEYRHTLDLARTFGIRISPHTFDGALSKLYAVFAQACLPPWSKMSENDIEPVEWDVMENPFAALLPLKPTRGKLAVPTGVGIGMELDYQIIKHYRLDQQSVLG